MNIFVLDTDPQKAAQYHCDKHVVKMITESCQLLSTWAHNHPHLSPIGDRSLLYKPTHQHHPCNIWLNESLTNVAWLLKLTNELIIEYHFRFGKLDNFQSAKAICNVLFVCKPASIKLTPFKLCMPDYCIIDNDPVLSYRNLYKTDKAHLIKYTKRDKPDWL